MGYDLVTWAPRVGASGDDVYCIPGAKKLDGTQDTGAPVSTLEGDSSGFSTTPTIAQINASSGWNQLIGALNRRIKQYNTLFGTALSTVSYFTTPKRITTANLTALQASINGVRVQEGFASYTFTHTGTTAQSVFGDALAELRKSLAISGTMTLTPGTGQVQSGYYQLIDTTYPGTHSSESFTNSIGSTDPHFIPPFTPKFFQGGGATGPMIRYRWAMQYPIPDYVSAIASGSITADSLFTANTLDSSWNLVIYSSNTDDSSRSLSPAFGGFAWNTNNLEVTIASPGGGATYNGSTSLITAQLNRIIARAGGRYCLLYCGDLELSGGGSSGTPGTAAVDEWRMYAPNNNLTLVF